MSFSEMLNFRIRQFKRFDGGWGSYDKETGQWSGMIAVTEEEFMGYSDISQSKSQP